MAQQEIAKAVVDLDGSRAGKELEKLETHAKDLRAELVKLSKANDLAGFKQKEKELKLVNTQMNGLKKATVEVDRVLRNLNGESLNTLVRTQRQLSRELKEATRNTREEIAAYNEKAGKLKQVSDQIRKVKTESHLASGGFNQMGSGAQRANAILSTLRGMLPALGIGVLISQLFNLTKEFFNLSKEIEQFDRKARIVFGDNMPKVTAEAAEHAHQLGLTRQEYIRAAANVADLLVPLGFTRDVAAGLSIDITNLSGALSEWTGGTLNAADVNQILSKALLGEAEQIKQLGIVIDQSSKDYNKRIQALQETHGLTLEQAKAMDILNQIQQKSTDAQTAFAQKGETLLRIQRNISTWWRQMKENVVEYFRVPVSEKISREKDTLNLLVDSIVSVNDNQEVRKRLIDDLQKSYPGFLANLDAEKVTNEDLRKRLSEVNAEYDKKIRYQVYEEDLEENMAKARLKRKEQDELVKTINSDYEKYIQIKEKDLTFEEKAIALSKMQLNLSTNYSSSLGTLSSWEDQLKVVSIGRLEKYNALQKEINKLGEEYNGILIAQSALGIIKKDEGGGGKPPVSDDVKKRLEAEKKFRDELIFGALSLIEQENISFEKRLEQAGIYGKKREKLTEEELRSFLVLEKNHIENIAKIHDQAFNDEVLQQKQLFDTITLNRQIAHNNYMASLGSNEAEKSAADRVYKQQELERQENFLKELLFQLQGSLDGDDVFSGIDESLLSEEQKAALLARIDEVNLALSELGLKKAEIAGGGEEDTTTEKVKEKTYNIDILGMSSDDWKMLLQHFDEANNKIELVQGAITALTNAWSEFYAIKNNLDKQDLQRYELDIQRKKDLLKSQLDNGRISQEQYTSDIAALDEGLDSRRRIIAQRAARREKQVALMNAIVNTASSIVKMLNNPWPLNLILAALVGVAGGLQIAKIATTPLPQYFSGKYDVIGQQDGKRYNAGVIDSPRTGLINSPSILVGEKPEIIIDPYTTRNLQMNYPEVIQAIMTARVPQFSSGSYPSSGGDPGPGPMATSDLTATLYALQKTNASLSAVLERVATRGISAKLVADSEYIEVHNEMQSSYNTLRNQVDLRD